MHPPDVRDIPQGAATPSRRSIRSQFKWLVLTVMLPLLLFGGYEVYVEAQRQVRSVEDMALRLARVTAADTERTLDEAGKLLADVAARPAVRAAAQGRCDPVFAYAGVLHPRFNNLVQFDLSGRLLCSAMAMPAGMRQVPEQTLGLIRRAAREKKPAIGPAHRSAVSGRWTVLLASPVLAGDGAVSTVLGVAIELKNFNPLAGRAALGSPAGSHFVVLDGDGTVIARLPDPDETVGRNLRNVPGIAGMLAQQSGTRRDISKDGTEKIYGFVPIADTGWLAVTSLPIEHLAAEVAEVSAEHAALIAVVLILMTFLALRLAERIERPIERIAAAARRIQQGEGGTRLPVDGAEEIAAVATQINGMLDTLAENRRTLEAHEARLSSIFSALGEGVLLVEDGGHIVHANAAAERILGRRPEGLAGADVRALLRHAFGEDGAAFAEDAFPVLRALREGRQLRDCVIGLYGEDATPIWLSANVEPISRSDAGGLPLSVVSFADITARMRDAQRIRNLADTLEQRVAERTADLERANAELEAFSYSVSHDLRAPLRALNGYAQILGGEAGDGLKPEYRAMLGRIGHNAVRMGELIDDLLQFSRLGREELRRGPVRLTELAQAVVDELHEQYPAASVRIGPLPVVDGDLAMLRQALVNLVGNALKFSTKRSDAAVEVDVEQRNGEPVVFVRDNGAGFDMQYAGKLFGVFQRMHKESEFPGTGVGLAIVKRVIERHGGRVWAESMPGQGATFFFTLPANR